MTASQGQGVQRYKNVHPNLTEAVRSQKIPNHEFLSPVT